MGFRGQIMGSVMLNSLIGAYLLDESLGLAYLNPSESRVPMGSIRTRV